MPARRALSYVGRGGAHDVAIAARNKYASRSRPGSLGTPGATGPARKRGRRPMELAREAGRSSLPSRATVGARYLPLPPRKATAERRLGQALTRCQAAPHFAITTQGKWRDSSPQLTPARPLAPSRTQSGPDMSPSPTTAARVKPSCRADP